MKCPSCNKGTLEKKNIKEEQFGISLGEYLGLQCTSCGETFFDEKVTQQIIEKSKEKGLFGMEMTTKVTKTGNSLAVRIPKKIADFLKLKEGKEVRIHPAGDKLVIES